MWSLLADRYEQTNLYILLECIQIRISNVVLKWAFMLRSDWISIWVEIPWNHLCIYPFQGLIPRAKLLLTIGGTFFLGFGPLILIIVATFSALYFVSTWPDNRCDECIFLYITSSYCMHISITATKLNTTWILSLKCFMCSFWHVLLTLQSSLYSG